VYGTDHNASVNRAYYMDDYAKEKRREQNLMVHVNKSEAEVTNNRRLHWTYCTIEASYRQT